MKTSVFYLRFQALFSLAILMMTRLDTAAVETWVRGQFSLYRGSSRNLTSSHTTHDAFMNWSFAFSRDVSLGRQCFYQLLRKRWAKIQIHDRNIREPNHFPLFHSVKGERFAKGSILDISNHYKPNEQETIFKKQFSQNLRSSLTNKENPSKTRLWEQKYNLKAIVQRDHQGVLLFYLFIYLFIYCFWHANEKLEPKH